MENKKIKILFLDHSPFIGGAQLALIKHLEKIDKNKIEIIAVYSKRAEGIGLASMLRERQIKYHLISFEQLKTYNPLVLLRFISVIKELNVIIKKEKADIIFGNTVRANIISSLAALLTGKKNIWFIWDYTFPKLFFKLLKAIPVKILYVSESIMNYYAVRADLKNEVMHIWSNMHEDAQRIKKEDIESVRKNWGVNDQDAVVGYFGRLVPWKGPQVMIEAIVKLRSLGIKNIKGIIIGTGKNQKGNNEEHLKSEVIRKSLQDHILFMGFQRNIPLYLRSFDIFCLTSIESEPYSSTVIEAMQAKISVIGTDLGGTPEIIKNGVTGLLIKADDPDCLCEAILKILNNESLKTTMISNAFNEVIQNNTADFATRRLENIYFEALNNK